MAFAHNQFRCGFYLTYPEKVALHGNLVVAQQFLFHDGSMRPAMTKGFVLSTRLNAQCLILPFPRSQRNPRHMCVQRLAIPCKVD